jgi:hypothetical protein
MVFHIMALIILVHGYLCLSIFRLTYHSAWCHSPEGLETLNLAVEAMLNKPTTIQAAGAVPLGDVC